MDFTYNLGGDPAQKLEIARYEASKRGYTLQGTVSSGVIKKGFISVGSYVVNGYQITVHMNFLPPGWTWEQVDAELRAFLEQ